MRLFLVRHGETVENKEHIMQGQIPGHLSPEGIFQAEQLAERLRNEQFDAVYVSDLDRTRVTATIILKYHADTSVEYVEALREINGGIFQGGPGALFRAAHDASGIAFGEYAPPGGESWHDVQRRVYAFYESILVRHPDETVLFVSHGGTMATLLLRLFGEQLSEEQYLQRVMANSGVTILEVRDGRAHLTLFNCTRHLR